MRPRIRLAKALIRLGEFIQNAAIMVMRPDDLVEFSRETYSRPHNVAGWGSAELIASGLYPQEAILLEALPLRKGKLLLLGVGGGREAIPLAKMGFQVTGVDFVPEMVALAKRNATNHGVEIEGFVQEVSDLEIAEKFYDVVWLSAAMYSCVPTRERRIIMLQKIHRSLTTGGYLIIQFSFSHKDLVQNRSNKLYKAVAVLTRGNLTYEPGDTLRHRIEFIHEFSDEEEVRKEFFEGGFSILHFEIFSNILAGGAVLKPEKHQN